MPDEATTLTHPTLLFDGYCNLCSQSVIAIIKRDPRGIFRFASLQSPLGQTLLAKHHLNADDIDSVVLIHHDSCFIASEAVFEVLERLGGLFALLTVFRILPLSLRNWIYQWIAGNRYSWFGKKDVCMVPTPELEGRFLS